MLNENGMIPKVKGGLSNPWGSLRVCHILATHLNLCSLLVGSSYSWGVVGGRTASLFPMYTPSASSLFLTCRAGE